MATKLLCEPLVYSNASLSLLFSFGFRAWQMMLNQIPLVSALDQGHFLFSPAVGPRTYKIVQLTRKITFVDRLQRKVPK